MLMGGFRLEATTVPDMTRENPSSRSDSGKAESGDQADSWCESTEDHSPFQEMADSDLVRPCDIKGVLHSHSRWGDGAHSLRAMIDIAREIGLDYLGISDHFRSSHHTDGLDLDAVATQREEIERLNQECPEFDILQGVELDAFPDGSLPLDDATLQLFDYVLASLPDDGDTAKESGDPKEAAKLATARALRVIENPLVTILAKPVGDFMLRQPPVPLNMAAVLTAAAKYGTAVEVDANPACAELDWTHCHMAQELGVYLSISPNAHRAARLVDCRHGAEMARNAGICCRSILNTLSSQELRRYIRRDR